MQPHEQSIFNPADGAGCGAGFGSLAIPVMALAVTVPPPPPAAILKPVLLLMDLLRMAAFRKSLGMKLVKFLVSFWRDGTPMGALPCRRLDTVRVARTVAGMAGRLTTLFLAQRQVFPPGPGSPRSQTWLGVIPTATSGFTSFVAHASGPPLSGQVIPLRLSPHNLPAAWLFYFFVINLFKWIPYGLLGLFDLRNMATSLGTAPASASRCMGRRAYGKKNQPADVLPIAGRRHGFDRLQTAVGWFSVKTQG